MLIEAENLVHGAHLQADVTIAGAGAAEIVMAIELERAGLAINLVESGGPRYWPRVQALADTEHLDPKVHPPMSERTRRQVGGTSVIWGGRVVPFDPIDFDDRPYLPNSRWPLGYEAFEPYFAKACGYLQAGLPGFDIHTFPGVKQTSIVPGLPDGDVVTSTVERWSVMNFGTVYANQLKRSQRSIWEQAGDGFHQIGTTRMSEHAADGVVGPNGHVHGFNDLFIASSTTFVTASQANSMFMILALSLRIADNLANSSPTSAAATAGAGKQE